MALARRAASLPLAALARLVVASCLVLVALPAPRAHAGWWDDLDKGDSVTLSDLCSDPVPWRGKVVTFACIFNEPAEIYSPYFTSFSAETHWNVTAWLDGSPLWDLDAFQRDDFPFLYLPRNHTQARELFGLPRFTRIEITGKVRDVYRSRPWIEIQAFRATAATLGSDVVSYVKSGDGYAAQGNYANAEAHYKLALAQIKLADVYRMRIEKRLASVLRAAGKDLDARKVEGGSPILGAKGAPLPDGGAASLPDARAAGAPGAGARPPSELTDDLPGDPAGTAPRAPATSPGASLAPPPPSPDAGFRPVAPPAPGAVVPPSELTDDLPGTPSDAGPVARAPLPSTSMPAPSARPTSPANPPLPPAPPTVAASPAASAAPAPPVPPGVPASSAPPPPPAPSSPPAPPPRQPRLSGVK